MQCKPIQSFEITRDDEHAPPLALISFHEEDAPVWLKDSQLHRQTTDLNKGLLVIEGMGPHGAFTLPFGPMTLDTARLFERERSLTFMALEENGPAYMLELVAA
jgi:hypothetical protein